MDFLLALAATWWWDSRSENAREMAGKKVSHQIAKDLIYRET